MEQVQEDLRADLLEHSKEQQEMRTALSQLEAWTRGQLKSLNEQLLESAKLAEEGQVAASAHATQAEGALAAVQAQVGSRHMVAGFPRDPSCPSW